MKFVKRKKSELILFFIIVFSSFLLLRPQKISANTVTCGERLPVGATCSCGHEEFCNAGNYFAWTCCGWCGSELYECWAQEEEPDPEEDSKYELCSMQIDKATNTQAWVNCTICMEDGGIWTAVGCIPQTPEAIVKTLIEIGLIISGAIVLIMILAGAFMLSTSQGDPKKTQDAKELISSAIIGLLFIIFSITILQFVGVSILRIPGFGE
jgi:hypothetical protein